MPVDLATVRRIARLAHIAISDAEAPALQGELNAILTFVEALEAVDVTGVEPMTSVTPMEPQVLANAPLAEDGFFVVPKVVE